MTLAPSMNVTRIGAPADIREVRLQRAVPPSGRRVGVADERIRYQRAGYHGALGRRVWR